MIEIDHLDLNIVSHCNMRCVSCSHVSPFTKAWEMHPEMIRADLQALKPILKPRSINVVGGEPLLYKGIVEILKLLKEIRIDEKTVVITNGKLLPRMHEDFWNELECLKISIYGTTQQSTLDLAEEKCAQYGFELISEAFPEFFIQFEESDGSCFNACSWKSDCYTVHDGHFYLCPQSAFFHRVVPGIQEGQDGLPLWGITEESLRAFMDRTEPLEACKHCAAWKRVGRPWKEAGSRPDWIADSIV